MSVKHLLIKAISSLPLKYIIFESRPDLSDNTKYVFDEMIRRGLNKKYIFVWACGEEPKDDYPKIKNVRYIYAKKNFLKYYLYRAKCAIFCNQYVLSNNERTMNYYLCHGTPLKNTSSYYGLPNKITYTNSTSEAISAIRSEFYHIKPEKLTAFGYPRNDEFAKPAIDLHPYFDRPYLKIIAWYPTVRQFLSGRVSGSDHALPVVWDQKAAEKLNEFAKQKNTLIVIKPHFVQDLSYITDLNLSNIVIIHDDFFKKHNIVSYAFLAGCDALLSDYSSVYYDYTLCDKPIGLIWEDYKEYESNPGFAVDMDYMMKGGVKIYTLEDLLSFVSDVAENTDRLKKERQEIRDYVNCSTDGKNSERVVDFIIEKAGL